MLNCDVFLQVKNCNETSKVQFLSKNGDFFTQYAKKWDSVTKIILEAKSKG